MKTLTTVLLLFLLFFAACSAEDVSGSSGTTPAPQGDGISGSIILDNNISPQPYPGVNLSNSKCYIKIYDSSNNLITFFSASNNPSTSSVGTYYFEDLSFNENSEYKVLMYIKAGSNFIVLNGYNYPAPQIVSIDVIKGTAGYNAITGGSSSTIFENFANGYPIQTSSAPAVVTTDDPSLENPVQE